MLQGSGAEGGDKSGDQGLRWAKLIIQMYKCQKVKNKKAHCFPIDHRQHVSISIVVIILPWIFLHSQAIIFKSKKNFTFLVYVINLQLK